MSSSQPTRIPRSATISGVADPERLLRTRRAERCRSRCEGPEAFASMGVERDDLLEEIADRVISETPAVLVLPEISMEDAGAEALRNAASKIPYLVE